jgi:AAA ATPase domain
MTEAGETSVSGGKGVVVGDHNTVNQYYAAPAGETRAPSDLILTDAFASTIENRARGFVGREFVFDEVDRLLAGRSFRSGYVVIRGEPGIGKTAVASMLVRRGGYIHHFNVATANIRTTQLFLQNVCAQLIVRYDLDRAAVPEQATTDGAFLGQLLSEAAERARAAGTLPVVIVIDALDEALDTGLPPDVNRLYLPRALADGVFFVLTTREEHDYRLDVDNEADIWIRDDDPSNRQDVARYIEGYLGSNAQSMQERIAAWGVSEAEFVTKIVDLSEGNFMYLVHVLPEIASGTLGRADDGGIAGIPRGLNGYYARHWRQMKDADRERFTQLQRPVLCFLAISREPVTVPQLMEWTRLEPDDVRGVIDEWREFLNEDTQLQPPRYRIYHRSFAEFLDEQESLQWYRAQIVDTALAKIPGFLDG